MSRSSVTSERPVESCTEAVVSSPAAARLASRSLRLPATLGARLIREAIASGGEIWVMASGQSMFPTIHNADDVLLSPMRRGVRRGDVVLVPLGPRLMLHRVVSTAPSSITTRGDARAADDRPMAPEDVLARAIAVRRQARVSTLVPTLRFGVAPLLRFVLEGARRRVNRAWRSRPRGASA